MKGAGQQAPAGRSAACGAFGAVLAAMALVSCGAGSEAPGAEEPTATPEPPAWFVETASAAGLDFAHRSGHDGRRYLLPESVSGGGALFDADGDGFLDAYLVQSFEPGGVGAGEQKEGGPPAGNRLYLNVAGGGGGRRFVDVTAASGADDRGYGMGVATGDYDLDGDLDLYVTNLGPNVLLRNDSVSGRLAFTDVTAAAGVGDPGFGASAAFVDYDLDGDLDLYGVNHVVWSEAVERDCRNRLGEPDYCDPTEYDAPAPGVLFRNEGPGPDGAVRFRDVRREAGIDRALGNGLGVVVADFDGNGLPDIFVSNDRMPDHLWLNRADAAARRFSEEGALAGCAVDDDGVAKAGMGVDAADVDDDGDPDLVVGNFSDESDSFYRNEGVFFVDVSAGAGVKTVSRPFTRFGLGLLDFDNDGRLDLYQATGRVSRQERRYADDPYAEPNLLFRGAPAAAGGLRFAEVLPRGGTKAPLAAAARAAAFGDVDNDGGVDVLVVNRDGPVHLLRNVVAGRGHWISFRVLDERGGDALGAVVEVRLGERRLRRLVRTAYSYLAASDPRAHFGLGAASAVRDVAVSWPDGARERFGDFDGDQIRVLRRGEGAPVAAGG